MKKAAVLIAEGLEEIEGLTVVDILRRAGVEVLTVSITGHKQITGAHNIKITTDVVFEDVDFEQMDAVVLPGGMPGTTNLKNHDGVIQVIQKSAASGKLVAAICAAPSVLGQAGILQGKAATCYPGFEDQLTGAIIGTDAVVQDGNIITSRGMGTAILFALALTANLVSEEKAAEIRESIQYVGA